MSLINQQAYLSGNIIGVASTDIALGGYGGLYVGPAPQPLQAPVMQPLGEEEARQLQALYQQYLAKAPAAKAPEAMKPRCECGVCHTGGLHSSWCPEADGS